MHEDNDWGISLVEDESTETVATSSPSKSDLAEGLQVRFFVIHYYGLGDTTQVIMLKMIQNNFNFKATFYFSSFSVHMILDQRLQTMMKKKLKIIHSH